MNVKGNHHESSTNGRMIQAYTSYFQISELQPELYSSWSRQNMELSLLFSNTGNMECCIIFMIIMQYSNTQKITYCITISPQKRGVGCPDFVEKTPWKICGRFLILQRPGAPKVRFGSTKWGHPTPPGHFYPLIPLNMVDFSMVLC